MAVLLLPRVWLVAVWLSLLPIDAWLTVHRGVSSWCRSTVSCAASYQEEEEQDEEDEEGGGFTKLAFAVAPGDAGARLDRFLSDHVPGQSRSYLGSLCAQGHVVRRRQQQQQQQQQQQEHMTKKSQKLRAGDLIEVTFAATSELEIVPEAIPLEVLYEDEDVIAVNKAVGMVVHPAPGNWNGTLVNALAYHLRAQEGHPSFFAAGSSSSPSSSSLRPGIVHRLDKGTSGIIIAAKNAEAQARLSASFKERRVGKAYLAVCVGQLPTPPPADEGDPSASSRSSDSSSAYGGEVLVDEPIGRHPEQRHRMAVVPPERGGRAARSRVKALGFNGQLSLARVAIETGRTHQIRVHLAHLRHPILGDDTYGYKDWNQRAAAPLPKTPKKTSSSSSSSSSSTSSASTSAASSSSSNSPAPGVEAQVKPVRGVSRPLLHAAELAIPHPSADGPHRGKVLRLVCPPPPDFAAAAEAILGRPLDLAEHFRATPSAGEEGPGAEEILVLGDGVSVGGVSSLGSDGGGGVNGEGDGGGEDDDRAPRLVDGRLLAQAEAEGWY